MCGWAIAVELEGGRLTVTEILSRVRDDDEFNEFLEKK